MSLREIVARATVYANTREAKDRKVRDPEYLHEMKNPFAHPFAKFVLKKIFFYSVVAFVALNFIFLIPRLMPGNPIDQMIPPGTTDLGRLRLKAELEKYFGLDRPLHAQYINFWANLLRGDLGYAVMRGYNFRPVANVVMAKLPYTLVLVIPVLFIGFFLGNWIGARAAYMKGKRSEAVYFTSVFASQMPFYWFAMVLLFLLAVNVRVFPTGGTFSPRFIPSMNLASLLDVSRHYALPFLTLLIITTGGWATGMRSMTLYELDSGYILYARQLGFRKKKLTSYAERNAILPQFTGLNINLNNLIGMTMIIEMVFAWDGLGLLALDAIRSRDYFMMLGTFLVTIVVVVLGNFLVDLAYAFLDPRIRTGRAGARAHDVRGGKMGSLKTLAIIGGIIVGVIFTFAGLYGLAGGTLITYTISVHLIVLNYEGVFSPQEGGLIFSIIGTMVLLVGIAMTYVGFRFSWRTILSTVLGLYSLIILAILSVMGYNLVVGIAVLVFICFFVAKYGQEIWRARGMFELLVRSRKFMVGSAIVLAIILFGIIGSMLSRDPLAYSSRFVEPPSSEFLLGTGNFGEDVLAQLCAGTRNSLMIGAIAGGLAMLIAVLVGGIGPYTGGLVDEISNAFTNVVMVFPMLPLLILLAAILEERSMFLVAALIGLTSWPWAARCIRSQVLTLKERGFIDVARMSGMKDRKIVVTEIMPNMLAYIIIVFVVSLSIAVLTEAGLSMIGLGPDPGSNVTLGSILYWVMNSTHAALPWNLWWCFIPPGLILTIFLVAVFIVHTGMDQVFNPRLRKV